MRSGSLVLGILFSLVAVPIAAQSSPASKSPSAAASPAKPAEARTAAKSSIGTKAKAKSAKPSCAEAMVLVQRVALEKGRKRELTDGEVMVSVRDLPPRFKGMDLERCADSLDRARKRGAQHDTVAGGRR